VREATLMVVGQEVLTADQLTLKVSVVRAIGSSRWSRRCAVENYLEQTAPRVQERSRRRRPEEAR